MPAQAGLPPAMTERLKGRALNPMNTAGMTGDELHTVMGGAPEILKVSRQLGAELKRQHQALQWLEGKLPAPRPIAFEEDKAASALWMSRLDGEDASIWCQNEAPEKVAEACALALRRIHEFEWKDCPLSNRLDAKVELAIKRARQGQVEEYQLDDERKGLPVEKLVEQLAFRPLVEDLVFTHGDFCLPNLIFADGELQGFVDWGRCGIADRYQDLALLLRSLKYNVGSEMRQVVADAYGISTWDGQKLAYYQLLDEFF